MQQQFAIRLNVLLIKSGIIKFYGFHLSNNSLHNYFSYLTWFSGTITLLSSYVDFSALLVEQDPTFPSVHYLQNFQMVKTLSFFFCYIVLSTK
jgi:hypothetical protein